MIAGNRLRASAALIGSVAAVAALGACSGSSDSSSSSSPTQSQSASGSSGGASCTSESISGALPNSAQITSFNCSGTGGGEIAAVRFNPGPTVQFLKLQNGKWEVINADQVCGTASAGLDPKVLAYCTDTPTKSPSKSASKSASQSPLQ